ncbi:MAG: phosphoribosylanthranilate isomerase [Chloroflexi bacterium]|nr:phosphoribosylanthranilate isomerase [Chloroflexota bacterium]
MSVRVKICGVTTLEDALAAAAAGADLVGFNFWAGSKRRIGVAAAARIAARLPPTIVKVGVFVDAPRPEIERTIDAVALDAVQLHGQEPPEDCEGFRVKVVKAIGARAAEDLPGAAARYRVDYVLLDADAGSQYGGTGRSFDWGRAVGVAPGRLFLAGGLDLENVAAAVRRVRPYAVDVASGVETAPGKKDARKVREFIEHAKNA